MEFRGGDSVQHDDPSAHRSFLKEFMREIPLSKGFVALIDDEDYERVSQHKWCASNESRGTKWYAIRWKTIAGKKTKIRLHHFVLGITSADLGPCEVVDHKDHDGLNCQKDNLERITQRENMLRSEGWKRSISVDPFL